MLRRFDERMVTHRLGSRAPRLLQLAVFDLIAGCVYTVLVVGAAAHRQDAFGQLVWQWVELEVGGLSTVVSVVAGQSVAAVDATTIGAVAYRHLVHVCSFLTVACVVLSRRCWPTWSREFTARFYVRGVRADDMRAIVRAGYRMSALGLAATVFLIFVIPQNDKVLDFMNFHVWTVICVPILLAACCYFACYALTLRRWHSLCASAQEFGSPRGRWRDPRHTND